MEPIVYPLTDDVRARLGDALVSLEPSRTGFACRAVVAEETRVFEAATAEDAYGLAVLELLDG